MGRPVCLSNPFCEDFLKKSELSTLAEICAFLSPGGSSGQFRHDSAKRVRHVAGHLRTGPKMWLSRRRRNGGKRRAGESKPARFGEAHAIKTS